MPSIWSLPLLRTARMCLKAVLSKPEPKTIALGVAFGIAVGLVPKGNLIAVAMGMVLCAVRLNLVVGLGFAVLASLASVSLDPAFDTVGGAVLGWQPLRPFWEWVAHRPFASWTQFNNTVVMGSWLIGLAQIVPTYWLSKRAAERVVPPLLDRMAGSRLLSMWRRFEWGSRVSHAFDS